jgi:hypothetical protein
MNGGKISGNTAVAAGTYSYATGGGVSASTFSMIDGEISDNSASSYSYSRGGGVSATTFTMNGGVILGNTASSTSGYSYGGGVHAGTITKQGGIIYGSDADSALRNSSGLGSAVYAERNSLARKRNSTAATEVALNSSLSGTSGGWEASTITGITYSTMNNIQWSMDYEWHKSPDLSSSSIMSTRYRVNFTSTEANASITIQLEADCYEGTNYAFISRLNDNSASTSNCYPGSLIAVVPPVAASARVTIRVPTPGSHFVDIWYRKAATNSDGFARFKVLRE